MSRSVLIPIEKTFLDWLQSPNYIVDGFTYYTSMQTFEGDGKQMPFIAILAESSKRAFDVGSMVGVGNKVVSIMIKVITGAEDVLDSSQNQITAREYHESAVNRVLEAIERSDIEEQLNALAIPHLVGIDQLDMPSETIAVDGNGFVTELSMEVLCHANA